MTMTATQSKLQAILASDSLTVVLEDPGSIIARVNLPDYFWKVFCADVAVDPQNPTYLCTVKHDGNVTWDKTVHHFTCY